MSTPTKKKPVMFPNSIEDPLQDCHFQRGIRWRRDMLCSIQKAICEGISETIILKRLRRGGITLQKAIELVNESKELWEE